MTNPLQTRLATYRQTKARAAADRAACTRPPEASRAPQDSDLFRPQPSSAAFRQAMADRRAEWEAYWADKAKGRAVAMELHARRIAQAERNQAAPPSSGTTQEDGQ